jgi:hypothetical protein
MQGTKILDCSIDHDLLTVDLEGKAFSYGGGSVAELGLVMSILYAAGQLDGVERLQLLFDGKKLEYLPEGTGVKEPIVIPNLRNNFDPASNDTKVEVYLVLRDGGYIVPIAIAVADSAELYKKLKDPTTYGAFFDDSLLKLDYEFMDEKAGQLNVSFEVSQSAVPEASRSACVRALAYTVDSFVKAKPNYKTFAFDLEGDEVVALFDVDVTMEGVETSLETINREGDI